MSIDDGEHIISSLSASYPLESANRLMALLQPHAFIATPSSISRGKRHYSFTVSGIHQIYIVMEGVFCARRRIDRKVVGTFISPVILGWSGIGKDCKSSTYLNSIYLEPRNTGKLMVIPLQEAYTLVSKAGALMDVVELLSFNVNHLLIMGGDISDVRAQEIVLKMLRRLVSIPESMRSEFSVVNFIEERCMLARSTILRELGKLRQHGIIEMKNGRLVSLLIDDD
ncbi:helix-turn-helix domain-containing protein [Serratia quinivorans]|uniref:helix-turn-helix domain-containing protein n=1 Tax=Serratia quinivorans TaxID=137545 RepID=UPI0034C665AA